MSIEIHYKGDNEAIVRYNGCAVIINDCNKEALQGEVNSLVVDILFQTGIIER